MVEAFFHSKIRFKLLRFFLTKEVNFYSLIEIVERTKEKNSSLRKELKNLKKLNLIEEKKVEIEQKEQGTVKICKKTYGNIQRSAKLRGQKKLHKIYQVNTDFLLYPELKALFLKSRLLLEDALIKKIQKIGQVRLLVLTGFFVDLPFAQTDLLIVGRINRKKLKNLIRKFERDLDRSVNYTIMSTQEFKYRHDLTDRFLFNILENRKVVVIDKMNQES
jgi:hypothetical protein